MFALYPFPDMMQKIEKLKIKQNLLNISLLKKHLLGVTNSKTLFI